MPEIHEIYDKYAHSGSIYSWCFDLEDGVLKQASNLARHACVDLPVCLMPDAHEGYGMPIGGVVAVKKALIPNAVGSDIGCSMTAVQTKISVNNLSRQMLVDITESIKEKIPVGFKHRNMPVHWIYIDGMFDFVKECDNPVIKQEQESALYQIGTLGGGNHFIELQKDEEGFLWVMVHTGSRNLGKKVCDYYNDIAKDLCLKWRYFNEVDNDLAFLPEGTREFYMYKAEMEKCMVFSELNHAYIIKEILNVLDTFGFTQEDVVSKTLKTMHNFAAIENVGNDKYYIHRKGAVCARKCTEIIIPGSQGTASYICEGLGNQDSFYSSSHGAGRRMSRKAAMETLDLDAVKSDMNSKGIIHNIETVEQLDEAPQAYKDIDEVLKDEEYLVKPIIKLVPLSVIKG